MTNHLLTDDVASVEVTTTSTHQAKPFKTVTPKESVNPTQTLSSVHITSDDELKSNWKWNSSLLNADVDTNVPRFKISELQLGRMRGRGSYCVVNEIVAASLVNEIGHLDSDEEQEIESYTQCRDDSDRQFIADKCMRNGHARYCLKKLKSDIYQDPKQYDQGIDGLTMEMKILATLKHPHIIKIRGAAEGDTLQKGNFIIVDRLNDILTSRFVTWKKKTKKPWNKFGGNYQKLFYKRLTVAYELSTALEYLHKYNIIYRDLKPDNIGFDVRDDLKLFDFGLAKELPRRQDDPDGILYNLSARTGSLRYMAPEVALGRPYNLKADVYSFGILLWQMLSLETPFDGYNARKHRDKVVEDGARPKINSRWPTDVVFVMRQCWSEKIESRLNFGEIQKILKEVIWKNTGIDPDELDLTNKSARSR